MPTPDSHQNVTKRISLNYWMFYLSIFYRKTSNEMKENSGIEASLSDDDIRH
jgi:hypothetical protein